MCCCCCQRSALHLVCVQLQTVVLHPVCYVCHSSVEVGSGGGGVVGEGEDQLGVLCLGNYVETMGSDHVSQRGPICIDERGAE